MAYENIQRGNYLIGNREYYFRSRWEYVYASYLDFLLKKNLIKSWRYEPKFFEFPIKHGTTRYLPDFEVITLKDETEYHEVKGYMDGKSKTKLKRMAKYFPAVKVVLVDAGLMRSLCKEKVLLKLQ